MKKNFTYLLLIIATFSVHSQNEIEYNSQGLLTNQLPEQNILINDLQVQHNKLNETYMLLDSKISENKKIARDNSNWNRIRLDKLNGIQNAKETILQANERIAELDTQVSIYKENISILGEQAYEYKEKIRMLDIQVKENIEKSKILDRAIELNSFKQNKQTESQMNIISTNKNQNTIAWIIISLVFLLLLITVFILLKKKMHFGLTSVEQEISHAKQAFASLQKEGIKLDNQLLEVLEKQMKIQSETQQVSSEKEVDHSLALKVADEIVRMQKNIARMDDTTKGLKPLLKGLERIQSNFAVNGYEIPLLLNTNYDQRMNIDVINFVIDDELPEDKKIITKIIKPQVNFNNVLIQRAQVEVSQN